MADIVDNELVKISTETGESLVDSRELNMVVEFDSLERDDSTVISYYKIGSDVIRYERYNSGGTFFLYLEEYYDHSIDEAMEGVFDKLVSVEQEKGRGDDIEVRIRSGYIPDDFDFPLKIERS